MNDLGDGLGDSEGGGGPLRTYNLTGKAGAPGDELVGH